MIKKDGIKRDIRKETKMAVSEGAAAAGRKPRNYTNFQILSGAVPRNGSREDPFGLRSVSRKIRWMELFSIEHATNFIPCTRCSAECAEAKERSPPPRYANRTRHRRHPRETWFWHADSIQACLSSTPPLLSLLNPRRNSHSSRSHPLHAQDALFSIFLYPIVLCLAVYPWRYTYIHILNLRTKVTLTRT